LHLKTTRGPRDKTSHTWPVTVE